MRKRLFDIIQIGNKSDTPSTIFDYFISLMIITSIVTTVLMTFDELQPYQNVLFTIDLITIICFIIEYILRLLTADFLYPEKKKPQAVLSFVFSWGGIVDLLTIASFFMPTFFSIGIVVFRLLRVFRVMRLFSLTKGYDAFNVIYDVLKAKASQILSSIVIILALILMASICMYSIEHQAQPEVFKNAFSGVWWCVSAVFTVGYGDLAPITTAGRILAVITTILGVLLVAIPTGIISAGFVEHYTMIEKLTDKDKSNDFITVKVTSESYIHDLEKLPGLLPCAVFRYGQMYTVDSTDFKLNPGDKVLFTTEEYINQENIKGM